MLLKRYSSFDYCCFNIFTRLESVHLTLRYGLVSFRYMGAKLWIELSREIRNLFSKFLVRKENF